MYLEYVFAGCQALDIYLEPDDIIGGTLELGTLAFGIGPSTI